MTPWGLDYSTSSELTILPLPCPSQGYSEMFLDLAAQLCSITRFDAVSLQPNSGASGKYAGLMAIRAYHL